VLLAIDNIS